jgi:hypothetical protein
MQRFWRWVQRYGPELEQRLRRHLKPTNKSWRVDETYLRVKGRWCYCTGRSILQVPPSIPIVGIARCQCRQTAVPQRVERIYLILNTASSTRIWQRSTARLSQP